MDHAITIGGLMLTIGCFVGLVVAVIGIFMFMAGGMSDAPQAGDRAGESGCITFCIGAVILVGCILALMR
jgi:hypothetical protein